MWLSLKPEDNILCLHHNTFVGSMRFGRCCSRKGLGSNPRRVFCVESLHVLSRPVWVFFRYSVIPSQYKDINQIRLINWWINCRYKCERELLSVFMCISPPTEGRTVPESSRFSPCYSWDGLHPPLEPEVEKQKKQIFWHIYASLLSPVDDNYCAEERFHTHNITDWQTVNAVHAAWLVQVNNIVRLKPVDTSRQQQKLNSTSV